MKKNENGNRMAKLALLVVGLTLAFAGTMAALADVGHLNVGTNATFRTTKGTASTKVFYDSTTASVHFPAAAAAGGGTYDTTTSIDTRSWVIDTPYPLYAGNIASPVQVIGWTQLTPVNTCDTLTLALQVSPDGNTFIADTTYQLIFAASDAKAGYVNIIAHRNAGTYNGSTAGQRTGAFPYWRFIMNGSQKNGAFYPGARLTLWHREYNK